MLERALHVHSEACKPNTCSVMKDTPWISGAKEFAYTIAEKYIREWRSMSKNL
jgi:hypothetical protein